MATVEATGVALTAVDWLPVSFSLLRARNMIEYVVPLTNGEPVSDLVVMTTGDVASAGDRATHVVPPSVEYS